MFALAIYDTRSRSCCSSATALGLSRYFMPLGLTAWLLRVKFHLQFPDIDIRLDTQAIADFTALSFIPAPATAYRGIRAAAGRDAPKHTWK